MDVSIVWLDLTEAKVFQISEERMKRLSFRNGDEIDAAQMHDAIAKVLSESSRLLILGPGIAKAHFFQRLETNHPALAKRVIACEDSDHPSDPQIAAYAAKYFQKPV